MRDIERFLIQPEGSNLVIDDSQPTMYISISDQMEGGETTPSYDDYFDYYELFYYKSIRREKIDKFLEYLPWILGIAIGLLTVFAPTIISSITDSDLPTWLHILAIPIGIALLAGIIRLSGNAIAFFQERARVRYEKRVDEMSHISRFDFTDSYRVTDYKKQEEYIQYCIIIYFERLNDWTKNWKGGFYSSYLKRLDKFQGEETHYGLNLCHEKRKNRKRINFEKEDYMFRLIVCAIGTIVGALVGLNLWLLEDFSPSIIIPFTIGAFITVAFIVLTPNPNGS